MEAIVVSIVTAIGGIIAILIQKGREENKTDHNAVMEKLIVLHKDVHNVEIQIDKVEHKIDEHISLGHSKSKLKKK